ncbi:MAG: RNA polymerase sigma factor [Candidatus Hydrogenedentes bacterium]|nr:RNA polymerase sigma factor [Candidatus Hydrogenedentota bacterium]
MKSFAEDRMEERKGMVFSDEALMSLVTKGEDTAFMELVKRYQNEVFRFCYHYLKNVDMAKEAVQEVFLRVYIAKERYDTNKKFKPWLFCIARNLCINEIKRQQLVQFTSLENEDGLKVYETEEVVEKIEGGDNDPAEIILKEERHRVLWEEINRLPESEKEIVILRYFQKLHARDIAEILGSTEGAVRTKLHRTLKYLYQKIASRGEFND